MSGTVDTYQKLFGIVSTHSFYPDQQNPNLSIHPTQRTQQVMQNRKLLFHANAEGGGVYQQGDSLQAGEKISLSFQLVVKSEDFINRTELPNTLNFFDQQFYFTNHQGTNILCKDNEAGQQDLLDLRPMAFAYTLPEGFSGTEISLQFEGEVRRKIPVASGQTLVQVDLRGLPEGAYQLINGTEVLSEFLTINLPRPYVIGMIEIQFTYNPQVEVPEYTLPFAARKTYWQYLIVPKKIATTAQFKVTDFSGETEFENDGTVKLPDETPARQFTSTQTIALQQKPTQEFQLEIETTNGNGGQLSSRQTIHLPPAGSSRLKTVNGQSGQYYSEIYVYV